MKDLILFGIQGSGKGTQGKILAEKFGYKIFETGGELRKISAENSEFGKKIKSIIDSGNLVGDDVIAEIIENFLKNIGENEKVIFDGIPRNKGQLEIFENILKLFGRNAYGLYIKLEEKDAISRLLSRFTCVGVDMSKNPLMTKKECLNLGGKIKVRDDDNENSIKKRFENFNEKTLPVINFYKEKESFFEANGNQNLEKVSEDIFKFFE